MNMKEMREWYIRYMEECPRLYHVEARKIGIAPQTFTHFLRGSKPRFTTWEKLREFCDACILHRANKRFYQQRRDKNNQQLGAKKES